MRIVHFLSLEHFEISIKYADNIQLCLHLWEFALEFNKNWRKNQFRKPDRGDADINNCQNGRYLQ